MVDAFHPGDVLAGRYRLVRTLGEGGMGAVWVAEQLALERTVAVKVLRAATEEQRPRLRREALALASVRHPAVVQVHDYDETADGVPFIVLELVHGASLAACLARDGAFTAERAVTLALPLLDGLAAAHRAGVIHRDVKPENVLLADTSGGVSPKLLDFGIAMVAKAGSVITADGGVIGTPAYMAPEQVLGSSTDERADVWGAAVLIYEMLSGDRPFGSGDVFATLQRVVTAPPAYPREAQGLDGRLWSILMNALRKSPKDRTPSVPALHDALSGWLRGRAHTLELSRAPVSAPFAPTLSARRPSAPPPPTDDAPPSIDALIRAKLSAD